MSDISHESLDCRIVESSQLSVDKGDITYNWNDEVETKRFPEDVLGLYIRMPVSWKQVAEAKNESTEDMVEPFASEPVNVYWATTHARNMRTIQHPRWDLTGTQDKPTMSPSLYWIGVWHGFLKNGRLESC